MFLSFLVSYQVTDLEEIHKKVLSSQDSATREATAVRRALAAVYEVIKSLYVISEIYLNPTLLLYSGVVTAW